MSSRGALRRDQRLHFVVQVALGDRAEEVQSDLALGVDQEVLRDAGGAPLVGRVAVEKGLAALSTLQSSWQQLAADFDQVKQDLDVANPDAGSWLTTILNKANDEWNEALGVAKSLQRFGNLPVENKTYGEAA